MKDGKKSATLGPIRINEQTAKEYEKALNYYGLSQANFARMCIERLVEHYQGGDPIALPIAFKVRNKKTR
jgi:hypothetical protein